MNYDILNVNIIIKTIKIIEIIETTAIIIIIKVKCRTII